MDNKLWKMSKLKTDMEGFNSLPPRKEVRVMFRKLEKSGVKVVFVDLDPKIYSFWKNCGDTVIFSIIKTRYRITGLQAGLRTAILGQELGVNEIQFQTISNRVIIKFWWD